MHRCQYCYIILLLLHVVIVADANASVSIENTRVIYQSNAREVSLRLQNQSQKPVLVQSWIDHGDADAIIDGSASIPFILVPPIFRLDGERGQTLRIHLLDPELLPKDRESVYWVNVLDIPLKPHRTQNENLMSVALRSRIKLFYRPNGLQGSPEEAVNNLRWRTHNNGIVAVNNSSWHISLATLFTPNNTFPINMVSPKSSQYFDKAITAGTSFQFTWLDDYGAEKISTAIMEQ